ncbi:Pimeloyl-ACP methyl ester carboxylesterase [Bhargavaea ginsengi]|uniref:Pimeloyl-ACP methyl ester carboxylesterase n=1 Tax=Bhargavaea ginsengi TaxID=426757 RepID=A0A1H6UE50_9BACL|nr:alpha/beta hydrolase [Bhargavaea ginsengi]SEI86435.1 Pimeloyl-ACP methyl ester carboxylesterase [Bhargavaea ginsengi]
MEFYQVNVNGNAIQVADHAGEKGTIIAIHGLTGNHRNLQYYIDRFKGDYRVVAVDLRGRGNSAALEREPSIFNHAEDIVGLIKELGIENPILMGYSMGAFISAIVGSRLGSVKGVILLDGAAEMSDHQRGIVEPSLGRISKAYDSQEAYVSEIQRIYGNLGITWSDEIAKTAAYEVGEKDGHWENKSDEAGIRADFDSFYTFDPQEIGSKISCSVLLVYASGAIGQMPPLFLEEHYDKTKSAIRDLDVIETDANHYTLVFEDRPEVNQAIKTFLGKLGSA